MDDLDLLIEEAAITGELTAGFSPKFLSVQRDPRMVAVIANGMEHRQANVRAQRWTPKEEDFVRQYASWLSDAEMGARLGRSEDAVHIRRERFLSIPGATKREDWLTGNEVGRRLGLSCSKVVGRWIRAGILPGRMAPMDRDIYLVSIDALTRFAVNPENWIYFRTHRVQDTKLRRLIALRQERWGDEWWTPGQVAAYHGVTGGTVNARIVKGDLPAKRWGNWWIKRSDAVNAQFVMGRGYNTRVEWTEAGDCFLLVARAAGCSYADIDALAKWAERRAVYRHQVLQRDGTIPRLISRYSLPVQYDEEDGRLFCDWRLKFPRWAQPIQRFIAGHSTMVDRQRVAKILATWGEWHAPTPEERADAALWRHWSVTTPATIGHAYEKVQGWGVEPLR